MATTASSDRYTIISADTHAGGSHAQYRDYLEAKYLEDFDAWRAQYSNPYKDLAPGADRRLRNWDDEMRNGQQDDEGVVGEVIFPNTVPPFFPGFVLFAPPPKPEDYEYRLAGIRAHNRWLVDFCGRFPERRAGIGQIFMNDIDDAIADVTWIKESGLRGGVLIQPVPPDVHEYIRPLNDPAYDRLWAACQDLDVPINSHGGVGSPEYPKFPFVTHPPFPGAHLLHAPPAELAAALGRVRTLPPLEVRAHRAGRRLARRPRQASRRAYHEHPQRRDRRDALDR